MKPLMIAVLPIVLPAGYADEFRQAPVSTAFRGSGPGSQESASANSLPRGALVDALLTGRVGNIDTTRIGPATLAPARAVLFTTGRY